MSKTIVLKSITFNKDLISGAESSTLVVCFADDTDGPDFSFDVTTEAGAMLMAFKDGQQLEVAEPIEEPSPTPKVNNVVVPKDIVVNNKEPSSTNSDSFLGGNEPELDLAFFRSNSVL